MSQTKRQLCEERLNQARDELMILLASLSLQQWHTTVISEGQDWSVADIVTHLTENERGMSIQVHKIRQGRETVPEDFDLQKWNAGLKGRHGPATPDELLAGLAQVRLKTLEVLATINEDEWALQGRHPSQGIITIEQYYETMAGHDQHHIADIRRGLGLA
jgi:hypothetical protein